MGSLKAVMPIKIRRCFSCFDTFQRGGRHETYREEYDSGHAMPAVMCYIASAGTRLHLRLSKAEACKAGSLPHALAQTSVSEISNKTAPSKLPKPVVVSGKAILLGEHFVVYGAPAIAVSIPNAVTMTAHSSNRLQLDIPQWQLSLVPNAAGTALERALHALLDVLPTPSPVRLQATMHLPSGVGLGSSASLGVAVLRTLCALEGWTLSDAERYEHLFAWEKVFHGQPSGFDHATAMHGGLTYFERFSTPPLRNIPLPRTLDVLIAQIDDGASTDEMVGGVRRWRDAHPQEFDTLLRRAKSRADDFVQSLDDASLSSTAWNTQIGKLLSQNHRDLQQVGVSTPSLDAACAHAEAAGAWGAKLIGAGGGGCILALVDSQTRDNVERALKPLSQLCFPLHLPDERLT